MIPFDACNSTIRAKVHSLKLYIKYYVNLSKSTQVRAIRMFDQFDALKIRSDLKNLRHEEAILIVDCHTLPYHTMADRDLLNDNIILDCIGIGTALIALFLDNKSARCTYLDD